MAQPMLDRVRDYLWPRTGPTPNIRPAALAAARYTFGLIRELASGELSMRAMSLVYTTLLSMVPMLALAFSVLKALGVHNSLEPVLAEFLRPLGPQAKMISDNVIGFVSNVKVGILGFFGVVTLFYTAISLIRKVETSFNFIWRIDRARPLSMRIGEYLGLLMVGPVIMFLALGISSTLLKNELVTQLGTFQPVGWFVHLLTRLIPYLLIVGMFTFMYAYMPNTRVSLRSAAIGGITAGALWQTGSLAFRTFVSNTSNYNAIYSSFAIGIFLLIWLYVGWLILLIGCQLSFFVQRPQYLRVDRLLPLLSHREAECVALMVMHSVTRRYLDPSAAPATADVLSTEFDLPPEHIVNAIGKLVDSGLLIEAGPEGDFLIPAKDVASLEVADLWRAIHDASEHDGVRLQPPPSVVSLQDGIEQSLRAHAGHLSVREWVSAPPKA